MGLPKEFGIRIGELSPGVHNLISDVPGVTVGHHTVSGGAVQTGVTAILPHAENLFRSKCMAGCHVLNGFGKSCGTIQIMELGSLETPILLTNTLAVGTAFTALIKYMLAQNHDIGTTTGTANPVILECNDGKLNDIRGLPIREEHVFQALNCAAEDFKEGAVGAGRGMICHGLSGGIGSSSRLLEISGQVYTLGTLVLTNHGRSEDLRICGSQVPILPKSVPESEEQGSVIVILATDLPLSERQLTRLCKRVPIGLARTGSTMANGSGEIALAFTTANRIPHYPQSPILPFNRLVDSELDPVFRAVADTVEEAVLSSLFHAEKVIGRSGYTAECLRAYLLK